MKLKLFTIKDVKSETNMAPFTARSTGEGIRMFTDDVNSGNNILAKHPADFVLIELGTFDTANAEINTQVQILGLGVDYLQESLEPTLPNL